ncbi:KAP family P-loop NTPase fold protein [Phocaeicola faecicola]|uniref:KAP family P-loop NTPase fold protein n=1 Tax=Phocaeicola faecicola TaxID=2739389 RepID=UPI0015E700EC|nr:P-loop NTPase fold protein [Phocaeicola faecicola]
MKSSIIDIPRKYDQEDLFGIKIYQDALIEYIKWTETPITIALQGEWGSGKTSLMNLLRWNLCDCDQAQFFPIWINTWQYSLMKTSSQAIIGILEGIINQIGALNPSEGKWNESKKKIGGIFKKMASVGTKIVANQVGIDGDAVDELFGEDGGSAHSDVMRLKEEINGLVQEALAHRPDRKGFIFYIDDLDRIDPPVAVEILELLKNIFDLENCIFVLAIDYDVVIKGLKPKFGELTDKNEREFRSFFDKIIQLPFSMPVANYNVDVFLVNALKAINFFTEKELDDTALAENLSEIARLSVGSNPRSLKRLTNTLSLISIINQKMGANCQNDNKLLNFALVCMQIAYPYIYNQLQEEPDFKNWNEKVASKLKLRPLTEEEKDSLDAIMEFDEEWEKIVFRMCQKETYLSSRVFQVSGLLNKISELINNDSALGEVIETVMELSAVTNLKAFDSPRKIKINRDYSNYEFNGTVH